LLIKGLIRDGVHFGKEERLLLVVLIKGEEIMGYKCPKCGYERQPEDLASEHECPNCGVIYEKAKKALNELTELKEEKQKSNEKNTIKGNQNTNQSSKEPEQKEKIIKCPFCKENVNIEASVCPHCQKDIGLFTLSEREPLSFILGIVFAFVGMLVSYLIHNDFIREGIGVFADDSGCCLCLTAPILFMVLFLIALYAIGGFFVGVLIGKAYKHNEQNK